MGNELAKLVFDEQRRTRAQAGQNFKGVMSGAHRGTDGTILSDDPVEREIQAREKWQARKLAMSPYMDPETGQEPAWIRASRGMDAANQWALANGDEELAKAFKQKADFRRTQSAPRGGRVLGKEEADLVSKLYFDKQDQPSGPPKPDFNPENTSSDGSFMGIKLGLHPDDPGVTERLKSAGINPGFATSEDIRNAGGEVDPVTFVDDNPYLGAPAPSTFGRDLFSRMLAGLSAIPNGVLNILGLPARLTGSRTAPVNYMTDPWSNLMNMFDTSSGAVSDMFQDGIFRHIFKPDKTPKMTPDTARILASPQGRENLMTQMEPWRALDWADKATMQANADNLKLELTPEQIAEREALRRQLAAQNR